MNGQTHVIDDLPAYTLGSLDGEEKARVEAHLGHCPICWAELQAYEAVVEQLPLAAPLVEPPAGLRAEILRRAAGSALAEERPRAAHQAEIPSDRPGILEWLRRALAAPVPAWGLVGVAVLVVALLALNLVLFHQVASSKIANTFRVVQLASTSNAPQASAWMVVSSDGTSGTLITQRLPVLPEGKQYQLWLIRDGERRSGGVFSVDENGYASEWVYTIEPLVNFQQFGVTIEPAGGSSGPTGSKVLSGGF